MSDQPGSKFPKLQDAKLFPNKHKTAGDKKPDFTGWVTINGVQIKVAAWKMEAKMGGNEYLWIKESGPQQDWKAKKEAEDNKPSSADRPLFDQSNTPEFSQEDVPF